MISGMLPLLFLLSCTNGGDDTASVCCTGGDGDGGADDSGGESITAEAWTLTEVPVPTESLDGVRAAERVFRASGNDFAYIVNGDGSETHMLTQAWIQPEGDYCIGDPAGNPQTYSACTYTKWTAGRVMTTASPSVCLDDVQDQLLLVKEGGQRIELVGTSRDSPAWNTYNRVYRNVTVDKDDSDRPEGPCAARDGRLALSTSTEILLMDTSSTAWGITRRVSYDGGLLDLQWLGDSKWLLAHGKDGSVWAIDSETGDKAGNLAPAGDAAVMAVDHEREAVWIARGGDGRLVRIPLTVNGAGTPRIVGMCGAVQDLAVDYQTGAVHALTECAGSPSGWQLVVASKDGVHAIQHLDDTPLALIPPGWMGQLGVIVQTQATRDTAGAEIPSENVPLAWHITRPSDERPPLNVYIITTLEQPFTNATMACTADQNPTTNFQNYLDQLRENIAPLASLDIPVAVGVTWEFASKATECEAGTGQDILQELADAGFVLGQMIHDKPCYSCTDGTVPNEYPDSCPPSSDDYSSPTSAGACWPSNENYCARGDQDCWFDWVNDKQLELDNWIPGGAQFIFGADRHRLWDWEYIAGGYRIFDRADGSTGYDLSLFQGNWVYPEITDPEDPRAKDPAPWHPELLGSTWMPADVDSWEQDSVFSQLIYMPGNSVAASRLYDWQVTDMALVTLFEEISPMIAEDNDFDVLTGLIGQSLAHRTDRPATFYWHLSDLTGYPLVPDEGDDRYNYVDGVGAWKAQVDAVYGPDGLNLVQWAGPLDVRQQVQDWLPAP